jgi:hypothetical protein
VACVTGQNLSNLQRRRFKSVTWVLQPSRIRPFRLFPFKIKSLGIWWDCLGGRSAYRKACATGQHNTIIHCSDSVRLEPTGDGHVATASSNCRPTVHFNSVIVTIQETRTCFSCIRTYPYVLQQISICDVFGYFSAGSNIRSKKHCLFCEELGVWRCFCAC